MRLRSFSWGVFSESTTTPTCKKVSNLITHTMEPLSTKIVVVTSVAAALAILYRRRARSRQLDIDAANVSPIPLKRSVWVLAQRPEGAASLDHFRMEEHPLAQHLNEGEFVLQTLFLEPAPAMFGRIRQESNYAASVNLGEVMHCGGVAQVIRSRWERLPSHLRQPVSPFSTGRNGSPPIKGSPPSLCYR